MIIKPTYHLGLFLPISAVYRYEIGYSFAGHGNGHSPPETCKLDKVKS
jgi:hypothetical protein